MKARTIKTPTSCDIVGGIVKDIKYPAPVAQK